MATLKQLRLQARLSQAELGRLANVDGKTVKRAEEGQAIQEVKAYAIIEALSQALGRQLTTSEIQIRIL